MKAITPTKAAKYTRRHVYYRAMNGGLYRVARLCKHRPNWHVILEDGREFYVDPSTRFYVNGGQS